jgi:uncharacterized protein (DUF1778 family)
MPARDRETLYLRLSADTKRTLQAAASASHRSISEFVLESALARADEMLADRRIFELDATQWKRFLALLERSAASPASSRASSERARLLRSWAASVGAKDRIEKVRGERQIGARERRASRTFYERFDSVPSPTNPMHLFVLMKDVRRVIAER